MKKAFVALIFVFFAFSSNAASPNLSVNDFNTELLSNCVDGEDLGKRLNLANPLTVIGSLIFTEKKADGKIALRRQPMALPTIVSEAGSPDQTTCSITVRATADGALSILGVSADAKRDELYAITARLLTRQTLSTVAEKGSILTLIESEQYKPRFYSAISSRPSAEDFFLVDNINVYLVEVERYKRSSGGVGGVIAYFGLAGAYKKDESFRGNRLLVTGDMIPLEIGLFTDKSSNKAIALSLPPTDQLSTLSAKAASKLSESLEAASNGGLDEK